MKKIFTILAFMLIALFIFADDAMQNGGFESWTSGTPDNWTTIDSGINVTQESTIIHGGSYSASVEVTTGTQANTDFRQTVNVTNGTEYNISVWVYHTEGYIKARLFVDNYLDYSDNTVTGSWQELTYTYTATADETIQVGLRFYDQSGFDGSEIVYVDDFTMTYAGSGTTSPVITNIATSPSLPSSSDAVDVTADITDDGTIASAYCYWGLSETALNDSISMSTATRDSYITDSQIPAQANGTMVYYKVVATDNDNNRTESTVRNYTVTDVSTVTIHDIQYTTDASGDSPYNGQTVETTGIVTAVGSGKYFIQSAAGAWNGIFVFDSSYTPMEGDEIRITADVTEYNGLTELTNVAAYEVLSSENEISPTVITTNQVADEQYEGVLVKVENAQCTNDNLGYGEWELNDGSGACRVDDLLYAFTPTQGTSYNVTGPVTYTFSNFKIEPRRADDIQVAGDTTPPTIQSATASNATTVVVVFSEDVDQTTAETVGNYNITALTIDVTDAVLTSSNTVTLTTSQLTSGTEYTLVINGVEDLYGNAMSNAQTTFTYTAPSNINPGDIIINEIHYNPDGDDTPYEFLEIYNTTTASISLTGITFEDDDGHSVDLTGTTIDASGFVVITQTDSIYTSLSCPVVVTGGYFGLSNGGNHLFIKDGTTTIDSVFYDDAAPWPTAPDGDGPSLELKNPSLDNALAENWQASYVNGGTPGATNSTDTIPPSISTVIATSGTSIEVTFSEDVDQTTAETASNYAITSRNVTVTAAQRDASNHKLVTLTVTGMVSGNYTLTVNGVEDLNGNACSNETANFSYTANLPELYINEFLASNNYILADDHGEYDDWIEIYNPGTEAVDIGGYYITDDLTNTTLYQIPTTAPDSTTVPAGGYLILWADQDLSQGIRHINLKLSASGEAIGLYYSDGSSQIDAITFGAQTSDVSYGRTTDADSTWTTFCAPTPNAANDSKAVYVVYPNGGENLFQGNTYNIQWCATSTIANVKIELYKGGSLDSEIVASTVNDSVYEWTIPSAQTEGSDYTIKISDASDNTVIDESNAQFHISEPVVVPKIIITEIMQNPSAVSDSNGEWFEIYNNDTSTIDINGWTIKDNDTDSHVIDNGGALNIAPGQYMVLGINGDTAVNGGVQVDYVYSGITLGNGSDELVLLMADGLTEVDRVEWDNGATFPDPSGASMMFMGGFNEDNNDGTKWQAATTAWTGSAGDFGTPGAANGGTPNPPAAPTNLQVTINGNDVQLSWDSVADATGYNIYRSEDPNNFGSTVYDTSNTNSYTDTNAATGTKYFYKVTATN